MRLKLPKVPTRKVLTPRYQNPRVLKLRVLTLKVLILTVLLPPNPEAVEHSGAVWRPKVESD